MTQNWRVNGFINEGNIFFLKVAQNLDLTTINSERRNIFLHCDTKSLSKGDK